MQSIFRPDLLTGKVAFVTGGGGGINRGIVEALAAHGCTTVISSRSQERLDAAAAEIEGAHGQRCLPVAADVRDVDAVNAAVAQTMETFGRIDILVNGAAGNFLCPAANLSSNAFRTVMEIDTIGTFNATKACFDAYLKDHGGHVLNVSATLHYVGTPFQGHAMAAKAACDALVKNWAVEWGPLGIRVNAIAPGGVEGTEGMTRLMPPDMREKVLAQIPLGRFAEIEEIGNAAVYLCSPAAACITGAILVVDGGHWLTGMGF